jgi:hypothetical protein
VSPTVFRHKGYRFFFFSREESRVHIHVLSADGEAKVWVEPEVALERSVGYNRAQIQEILDQVRMHRDEIKDHWNRHFS